ncbi:hypothetical protein C1645_875003 [Glomus cerebriforme]|uniref:Arrestin-like N-terminal domain-containing protein n=1 Tax=Glomus cerebriforme TaxID=658196 RepID=A0A397T6V8_9GLOM|nr:hypothetical protein C1645_875003 [Glomus cerebriforme]
MTEIINIPPKSIYKKSSKKVFFSYPENQTQFLVGYYGVSPNASIIGTLHLRFPSSNPLLATKIDLNFKGYEKVKWTENKGESTATYRAIGTFVSKLFQIWKTSDPNGDFEEIQDLDIPFKINLPEVLPPTIEIDNGRGKIRYELIVNIKRKGNLWKLEGSEKSVVLSINFNKYALFPINLQPFNWSQLNNHIAKSRGLGYNITLENSIGGPNMPFIINLILNFHKQDFIISKISFGIKEYHTLIAPMNSRNSSFYLVEKDIKGSELLLYDGIVNTQAKLEIDKNNKKLCWTISDGRHIVVSHKIKIKIHCGRILTSNIKLETGVQIKNILLEDNELPAYSL